MIVENSEGFFTVTSPSDFLDWEILSVEDWKPGVKRVHMRKIDGSGRGMFMMVFAKSEYLKGLDVPHATG